MAKKPTRKTVQSAKTEIDQNSFAFKAGQVLAFLVIASIVAIFVAFAIKAVQSVT